MQRRPDERPLDYQRIPGKYRGTAMAAAALALTCASLPLTSWTCSTRQFRRNYPLKGALDKNLKLPRTLQTRKRSAMSAGPVALTQDELKKIAADKAVEYVESGMVLGLGTGSTAAFAVARIGELYKADWTEADWDQAGTLKNIIGVPTSTKTAEQAAALGIPLSILDDHPKIDLSIDGSDEVDPDLNLVKGRGGALLREKMVEMASAKNIFIVDETKMVAGLGGSGLAMPVEVVQFCWKYNLERLQGLPEVAGCEAKLRMNGDKPYVTDNSNYIVDLYFKTPLKDAYAAAAAISALEGVVEHGLFLDMAQVVIIAGANGIEVRTK